MSYMDLREQIAPHKVGDYWEVTVSNEERKQLEKQEPKEKWYCVKDQQGIWTIKDMREAYVMSKLIKLELMVNAIKKSVEFIEEKIKQAET